MTLVKTSAGQQALKDRHGSLTPRQRSAFILFDGKRTTAEILAATAAMGIMGRDMNTMHTNVGTMTNDVGEMSQAMQQMDVLMASMNGSMAMIRDTMNRVSYDMGKMVRPETIMTPFR